VQKDCADSDPCTIDTCNANGACVHTAKVCNDNSVCTTDVCVNGACVFTDMTVSMCEDNNECTVDKCDKTNGCFHVNPSPIEVGMDGCIVQECEPTGNPDDPTRWVDTPTGKCPEVTQCTTLEEEGCLLDRSAYLAGEASGYISLLGRVFPATGSTRYVANSLTQFDSQLANNFGEVYQFKVTGAFDSQSPEVALLLRESAVFFGYHPTTATRFLELSFAPSGLTTTVTVQFIFPSTVKRALHAMVDAVVAAPSMYGAVVAGVVLSVVALVGYIVYRRQ